MEEQPKVIVEKGDVSPEQMVEIEAGDFYTIKEIAEKLRYSYAWITYLVQDERIKGIKPVGGRWRIPKSEYQRLITEGIPPLPREEKAPPKVIEIPVSEEKVREGPKQVKKQSKSLFPWLFRDEE